MNAPVVSEASITQTNTSGSDATPAAQHETRNARTETVSSATQAVEPREHRRPNRPGIVWAVGSKLEARDFLNKWYTVSLAVLSRQNLSYDFIVSDTL